MKRVFLHFIAGVSLLAGCTTTELPSLLSCTEDTGCLGGTVCVASRCRPPSCRDGRINGLETDVDCGGAHCAPCAGGLLCLASQDCESQDCSEHVCVAATCTDGLKNGDETDIDCGGSDCGGCAPAGACRANSDCVSGDCIDQRCGAAVPRCGALTVCTATCVDTQVDPAHCGRCGNSCPAPQTCRAGQCVQECLGGTQACGGGCIDVGSNGQHCGACNQPCQVGLFCVAGQCVSDCAPPQTRCSPTVCAALDRDPTNCGTCGRACPSGASCIANQCVPQCVAPLSVCGMACVDTRTDPMHCGACNSPCLPLGNAARACVNSTCSIVACAPGAFDCNRMPSDGCEANLASSSANCGQCGRTCQVGDVCQQGSCCNAALPVGSYQASCVGCSACGGMLRCQCRDASQVLRPASFLLGPPCSNITNCNGVLLCEAC